MKHIEGSVKGVKDHKLFYQAWIPEGEIRGSVQIVHGIAEHGGRYLNIVNTLVPQGFACFADDHYGHGKSNGPRKYVDSFQDYIKDEKAFYNEINEKHPELKKKPRFILGHSMGSFIAFHYVVNNESDFDGLILSGFGVEIKSKVPKIFVPFLKLIGKLAPKASFDSGLTADFISHDPEVIESYLNDPLVCDVTNITGRLASELLSWSLKVRKLAKQVKIPILIQVGEQDSSMVGFDEFKSVFENKDLTIHIYDGLFHEVYNELEKDRKKVLDDLSRWINQHSQ